MKFLFLFLALLVAQVEFAEAKASSRRRTQGAKPAKDTKDPKGTKDPKPKPAKKTVTVGSIDVSTEPLTPENNHPTYKKNHSSKSGRGKVGKGGKGGKGKGGKSGSGSGSDICAFDPTNPASSLEDSFSFRADYCYSDQTCIEDRCNACGVENDQLADYYCESGLRNLNFTPNKNLAKCTECCQGKVSSVIFDVTNPEEHVYSLAATDAYFVQCSVLSNLLNKGEGVKTQVTKYVNAQKGVGTNQKICIAPVTNIRTVDGDNGDYEEGEINIDACGSGPSDGLKAVFGSNDVLIKSDAFPEGSATFHVSCSQSVNVGTCMVGGTGGSASKGKQKPPPEGDSCDPYPTLSDGSSTEYWSSNTAKYCSSSTTSCFQGNFANCGAELLIAHTSALQLFQ
ncbi:hypothetical protein TrRE_jg10811 [Triparma retinervis]|uniref:Uncharacterized protein n=1 Tax=Triparma retinervis TaxID=2557542 RepID=A0A9W7FHJ7_9STRA|nr:hypothetical protein TrRE_jg10811 [Triparma retinervis]